MKIALDIGHNCSPDIGASGIRLEDNCTREIGYLIISKLRALGHTVINVTPSDASSVTDSLQKRVNSANNNNVELYVSLHMNAFNSSAKGTEVYYYPSSSKGKDYAQKVLNEIVKLGYFNRGIKDGSKLYVVKNTKASSILIECCFCDNKEDMDRYNAENIANSIVKGITGQDVVRNSIQTTDSKAYRVVTGSFSSKQDAMNFADKLKSNGTTAYVVDASILE